MRNERDILTIELEKRRLRNPSYSMRAFARDLGISVTALADALNGKRRFSKKNLEKVAEALLLSPEQRGVLLEAAPRSQSAADPREILGEDVFRMIGDWQHLAILNLARLKSARADAEWVARRLGLEKEEAAEALSRLKRLGFVKSQAGKLVRTTRPFETTRDIPSVAIRKHHLGNLKLAEEALLSVPVELRDFGSAIMPMNLKRMDEVKKHLHRARARATDLAEKGECTEVYCLSVQLFPLTRPNQAKDRTENRTEKWKTDRRRSR